MRKSEAGFTLIEVLVAVLLLGTAATTAITLVTQQTRTQLQLEENLLARIVAENAMVSVVAQSAAGVEDFRTRSEDLGGIEFTYDIVLAPSLLEGMETVTVIVRRAVDDREVARLQTLRPQQTSAL